MVSFPRLDRIATPACLFASGAAALAYELIFARCLGLFLGHDGYASLATLAAFMGGLALGNVWLGRFIDRRAAQAAGIYAALETAVGVYALVFPALVGAGRAAFAAVASHVPPGAGLFALKFIGACALVMPATFCMGGTLPALVRALARNRGELGDRVARIYTLNCAGAAFGCLAADFWWIPDLGFQRSLAVGAALNLASALGVWSFARRQESPAAVSSSSGPAPVDAAAGDSRHAQWALGVAALSGFAAMLYEVGWMRLLALTLGSTTHAFSLMLAAMVGGLAAGSAWASRRPSPAPPLRTLGRLELGLGIVQLLSMGAYRWLPFGFARAASLLAADPRAYGLYATMEGLTCVAVMMVPAALLGAALPLASRAAAPRLEAAGGSVGGIFSFNTVGAVAGALAAGLWLMPSLGLPRLFGAGVGANFLAGALALAGARPAGRRRVVAAGVASLGVTPWLCGLAFEKDWRTSLTLGLWRHPASITSAREFDTVAGENRLKYYRDGAAATVSVNAFDDGGVEQLNLRVNGKPDASTAGDLATQLLLGHLPLVLHPAASKALVIGLGSGITAGAISQHPGMTQLDVVEISAEVAEASRLFSAWNHEVLEQPMTHLAIDDARSFLLRSGSTYDVIVSEPSNPWIAGVAGLFTREFYEHCRVRLAPDGLMVQWVHLYDNRQEPLDMILRTLASVFPEVSIWRSQRLDLILVASAHPLPVNLEALLARLANPAVQADLGRVLLSRPAALLSRELASAAVGRFYASADGPLHLEMRPRLEYLTQAALFAHGDATQWLEIDRNRSPRSDTLLAQYLRQHSLEAEDYRVLIESHLAFGLPDDGLLRSLRLRWQGDRAAAAAALEWAPRLPPLGTAEELEALRLGSIRPQILAQAARKPALARYDLDLLTGIYRGQRSVFYLPPANELRATLDRLIEADPERATRYDFLLAELAWDRGDLETCLRWSGAGFSRVDWGKAREEAGLPAAAARYIEASLVHGARADARALAERTLGAGLSDPWLDVARRRALE